MRDRLVQVPVRLTQKFSSSHALLLRVVSQYAKCRPSGDGIAHPNRGPFHDIDQPFPLVRCFQERPDDSLSVNVRQLPSLFSCVDRQPHALPVRGPISPTNPGRIE